MLGYRLGDLCPQDDNGNKKMQRKDFIIDYT